MNDANKMSPAEFNKLVDSILAGTNTVSDEAKRDPALHLKRGVHNETLLHFFVVESMPSLVQELAKIGAELDTENEFGNTPLMESIIKNDTRMVKLLLQLGANPNHPSTRDQNTALHVAADYVRSELVKLLHHAGAKMHVRNIYEESPADLIKKNNISI